MKYFKPELFEETEDGVFLVGQKCKDCGHIAFPRKRVCPECFSENLEDYLLSREGNMHSFCTTYLGVPHLEGPYINAYVDLPEKIRLYTQMTGCDPEGKDLHCDMPVEMVIEVLYQDEDGEDLYTHKFRPIKE